MPNGSDYGVIPYEVDEIIAWMTTYFNDNLPDLIADSINQIISDFTYYKESNDVINNNPTLQSSNSTNYAKVKETKLNLLNVSTALRLKYSIWCNYPNHHFNTRLYLNGSPAGSENNRATTVDPVEYTETLTCNKNDFLQLYIQRLSGDSAVYGRVQDFKICGIVSGWGNIL